MTDDSAPPLSLPPPDERLRELLAQYQDLEDFKKRIADNKIPPFEGFLKPLNETYLRAEPETVPFIQALLLAMDSVGHPIRNWRDHDILLKDKGFFEGDFLTLFESLAKDIPSELHFVDEDHPLFEPFCDAYESAQKRVQAKGGVAGVKGVPPAGQIVDAVFNKADPDGFPAYQQAAAVLKAMHLGMRAVRVAEILDRLADDPDTQLSNEEKDWIHFSLQAMAKFPGEYCYPDEDPVFKDVQRVLTMSSALVAFSVAHANPEDAQSYKNLSRDIRQIVKSLIEDRYSALDPTNPDHQKLILAGDELLERPEFQGLDIVDVAYGQDVPLGMTSAYHQFVEKAKSQIKSLSLETAQERGLISSRCGFIFERTRVGGILISVACNDSATARQDVVKDGQKYVVTQLDRNGDYVSLHSAEDTPGIISTHVFNAMGYEMPGDEGGTGQEPMFVRFEKGSFVKTREHPFWDAAIALPPQGDSEPITINQLLNTIVLSSTSDANKKLLTDFLGEEAAANPVAALEKKLNQVYQSDPLGAVEEAKNILTPVLDQIRSIQIQPDESFAKKREVLRLFAMVGDKSHESALDFLQNDYWIGRNIAKIIRFLNENQDTVKSLLAFGVKDPMTIQDTEETVRSFYHLESLEKLSNTDWSNVTDMIDRLGADGDEEVNPEVLVHRLLRKALGNQGYSKGALDRLRDEQQAIKQQREDRERQIQEQIAAEELFVSTHVACGWIEVQDNTNSGVRIVARPLYRDSKDLKVTYITINDTGSSEGPTLDLDAFNRLHSPLEGSGPFIIARTQTGSGEGNTKKSIEFVLMGQPSDEIGEKVILNQDQNNTSSQYIIQMYQDPRNPDERLFHVTDKATGNEQWINIHALIDMGLTYKGHKVQWDFAEGQHRYFSQGFDKGADPIPSSEKSNSPEKKTLSPSKLRYLFAKCVKWVGLPVGAFLAMNAIDLINQGIRVDPTPPPPDAHTEILPVTPAPPVALTPDSASPSVTQGSSEIIANLVVEQQSLNTLQTPYQRALAQAGPDAATNPSIQLRVLVDVATANPGDVQASIALAEFLLDNEDVCNQNPAYCARHLVNTVYLMSQQARAGGAVDRTQQLAMSDRAVALTPMHPERNSPGWNTLRGQAREQNTYLARFRHTNRAASPDTP